MRITEACATVHDAFSSGVRCGHVDGWGRAGSYVTGEESILADEAFANGWEYQSTSESHLRDAWINGYVYGYRLAAEGTPLPGLRE